MRQPRSGSLSPRATNEPSINVPTPLVDITTGSACAAGAGACAIPTALAAVAAIAARCVLPLLGWGR